MKPLAYAERQADCDYRLVPTSCRDALPSTRSNQGLAPLWGSEKDWSQFGSTDRNQHPIARSPERFMRHFPRWISGSSGYMQLSNEAVSWRGSLLWTGSMNVGVPEAASTITSAKTAKRKIRHPVETNVDSANVACQHLIEDATLGASIPQHPLQPPSRPSSCTLLP